MLAHSLLIPNHELLRPRGLAPLTVQLIRPSPPAPPNPSIVVTSTKTGSADCSAGRKQNLRHPADLLSSRELIESAGVFSMEVCVQQLGVGTHTRTHSCAGRQQTNSHTLGDSVFARSTGRIVSVRAVCGRSRSCVNVSVFPRMDPREQSSGYVHRPLNPHQVRSSMHFAVSLSRVSEIMLLYKRFSFRKSIIRFFLN